MSDTYLETIKERINSIVMEFGIQSKRYCFPKPPDVTLYQALNHSISHLLEDYKKEPEPNKLINFFGWWKSSESAPDTLRLNQIDLIQKINNDLLEAKVSEECGSQILLGALLYRYLRLKEVYVVNSAELGSRLFCVLKKKLNINEENQLDALTVHACLLSFRAYLQKEHNQDRYPYVKTDPEFFPKLDHLILDYDERSKPILSKIKVLEFIQCVFEKIEALQTTDKLKAFLRDREFSESDKSKFETAGSYYLLCAVRGLLLIVKYNFCPSESTDEQVIALRRTLVHVGCFSQDEPDEADRRLFFDALNQVLEWIDHSKIDWNCWPQGYSSFRRHLTEALEQTASKPAMSYS